MLQTPNQDDAIANSYRNKFIIALDFESLHSVMPYYQAGLGNRLSYRTTFSDYGKVNAGINFIHNHPPAHSRGFAPKICPHHLSINDFCHFWNFHYNGKNWRLTTFLGLFVALKFYVLKENYSILD